MKNRELNNEHDSLVLKIKAENRMLQLTGNELNKKRELLGTIENNEDYTILKNKVEEQVNEFVSQKRIYLN